MTKPNIEAIYPLSPLQRGILFHSIYDPDWRAAYVVQLSCPLYGNLDVAAFKSAWQRVVDRHPILRTLFTWEERDEPLQIVRSHVELPWKVADWRHLSASEQSLRLESYLQADRERGFELNVPPLMRMALIHLSPGVHQFIWTKHHLLLDGWSSMTIMEETLAFYEAFRRNRDLVLARPRPYRDYIAWLKQQDMTGAERFWRQLLKGFYSPTPLPMQFVSATAPAQEASDCEVRSNLPPALTRDLQLMAREHGVTLNTLILGAWTLLLSRYSGEPDVVVGATISGRPAELSGVESMVGLFINTLPVRLQVSGEMPLLSWLKDLQAQQAEARQYEYSPLVDVQGWSDVPRGVPLFSTYLVFENYPTRGSMSSPDGDNGAIEIGEVQINERPNYPLLVVAIPGEQLQLRVLYNSRRYDTGTATRILRHLQRALESIVASADKRLSEVAFLSQAETHQALVERNDTQTTFPREISIPSQFAAQATKYSDAVAVRFEDELLSYRELDLRANRLANFLQQLGVGPDVRVALCIERSIEMVVGLLAILKAGGAYVPLDPGYPAERLAYIIEDSGAAIVLTQARLRERLPQSFAIEVCLDAEWETIAQESGSAPELRSSTEQLAYMLYTSGSTGKPKGVAISSGSLMHHMQWFMQEFALNERDRVLQKTPFSFDASVWEFWAALLGGGELVMARPGGHADGEYLVHIVRQTQVTILQLVPAQLRLMIEAGGLDECQSLRQVFCGGEALGSELQETATRHLACGLCNLYGPTEATIDTIFWRCEPIDGLSAPIGKPIANTQAYVLDAALEPVAASVAAHLYIAGPALGRGYWNKPDLTAERFIPDPFAGYGARMYRTGDLARYLNDGNLSYIGRIDYQVKVRGFRIEIGEIEELLAQHQSVRQAVVLVREDEPGVKRLVAYIAADPQATPDADQLMSYLRERLPEYMYPAAFVMLEAMPLTANGKIDRRALPRPEIRAKHRGYDAPRDVIEEALCGIWSQVLGVERVGIEDNFFELGGDSILCIQIVSRARQSGYNLAPVDLFEHQTIAQLAAVINPLSASQPEPEPEPELATGDVPLMPIQQRFFDMEFANPHHWNQAVLLTARETLDAALLEKAFEHLLQHHEALRFRFRRDAAQWRQFSSQTCEPEAIRQFDLADLPAAQRMAALAMAAADLQGSLDISAGPLLRVALFRLGDQQSDRLLIIIHHLVVDGVSWRILLEDLQSAYDQLAQGKPVQLLPTTTSFHRWAERLQDYSQTVALKQEAQYWLAAKWESAASGLPVDDPAGENTVASARTLSIWLSVEETQALLREVPAAFHTQINDALLSALVRACTLWTGQDSLLVALEGHGREAPSEDLDLSRTVGWFTTIFPVHLQLQNRHVVEALKEIKEQLRAIPRRGFAYGAMRYLSRDVDSIRRLEGLPRPQISFNYLGQFDQLLNESSLFVAAQENPGPVQDGNNRRTYFIDLNGLIVNGQLRIDWTYSENVHRRETVVNLADLFAACLRALIGYCQTSGIGGYTPSDFPLANIDQQTLDRVIGSQPAVQDVYPLSPMQQGVLFHSLYAPGPALYFVQTSCRIRGPLNVQAFKRAWQMVVDRHSILRTSFLWKGLPEPLQLVHEKIEVPWLEEDWRQLDSGEQSMRRQQFLERDNQSGFDFSSAPLLRLALLRTDEESYFFVWSSHHLLYDAWCRELIIQEVFAGYDCEITQRETQLRRARPYRDYIAWLKRQDRQSAEAFWKAELAGFAAPTHLACDAGRPSQQGKYREEQTVLLDVDVTHRLIEMAKGLQISMNILMQGAWSLILSAYSGESDMVFGTTVSGRSAPLEGIESMVGLFINTLPVRVQLRAEETIEVFLRRLQAGQRRALDYELTPLMQVQACSEVRRGMPLFEYLFLFQNYPVHGAIRERAGAMFQVTEVESNEAVNYPLMLVIEPGSQLRLRAAYDAERFAAHQITGLLAQVRQLLQTMAADAGRRITEIGLLPESMRHRVLVESNDTVRDYGEPLCIHERFDQQVERTPDRVALLDPEGQLTYKTLKARADRLANYLGALGVGPETRVAVCVERCADLVVGLLGVLKAGGAYVPLDLNYPRERLAYMLENAEAAVLLTQEHLLPKLSGFAGKLVCLDGDWDESAAGCRLEPLAKATALNLAYIIYTSGSTGKPKGVAVTHAALSNYIVWAQEVYLRDAELGFCLYSSLAFDLTVTSIYTPLITGNRVEVYRQQTREPLLNEIMRDSQAGILKLTPSHLMMIKHGDNRQSTIKRLIVGGEAFEASLARDIFDSFGGAVEIYNEYGPTEATVGCMIEKWEAGADDEPMVGIGRPAANARIYVLDRGLNPVAEQVAGELYIGGAGLARGYLGQPELTAERFVPDPFGHQPGARLYRSGDLARHATDGAIHFIGRLDQQVKIRGFRVEPSEIEAALLLHQSVREVKVATHKDGSGSVRLVAYLVLDEKPGPSVDSLRRFVGEKLPAYMVPAAFVKLASLPLNTNGKIDLHALATLPEERPELDAPFVAPKARLERDIATIWQDVLHLEKVGIHDNFFDLGGHSILLMQVHHQLEELLKQHLPMIEMFEHPTINTLAMYLTQQNAKSFTLPQDDRIERRSKTQHRLRQRLRQRNQERSSQAEVSYE